MKILTVIAFLFFVSCSNHKARIVEQIKVYKDSAKLLQRDILDLTIDETKKYKETFSTNGEFDLDKIGNAKLQRSYGEYKTGIKRKKTELEFRKIKFNNKIDSLELELKKY